MPNNDGQIHFTRVTRADLAVLHAWFARAHVAEWWGAPGSREEIDWASLHPAGNMTRWMSFDEGRQYIEIEPAVGCVGLIDEWPLAWRIEARWTRNPRLLREL